MLDIGVLENHLMRPKLQFRNPLFERVGLVCGSPESARETWRISVQPGLNCQLVAQEGAIP